MERDWHDIEKLLEGGEIDSVEDIKSHWRQIELLVGDTNDIFLQEGALLLSLVLGETDLASEFYANVEGMEMRILEGMRDKSLPDEVKSLLPKFKTRLLQCRKEVQRVWESGMQGDKRTEALVTQREKLFAQFKTFLDQIPQSRYRDLFKRQGYRCLMSLQNCQRSLLKAPEIAAFSRSLGAIAANTGDFDLFGRLFHVIYTTLRDTNESLTPQIASLLAAQCNEILSQHGHLLSPLVLKVLKAQGEATFKRVSESASTRFEFEFGGWLPRMIDSVSSLVHKWWGGTVEEKGNPLARQGRVTPSGIISSVNPALAGTIDHFLKSVRAVLVNVPLEKEQHVALQRLLQSERHIVDHLMRTCRAASKSELETEIKQKFIDHVYPLWPLITRNLDSKISKTLNESCAETIKVLTQTSTLRSLLESVKKLTLDRRVHALISYIFVLSSLVNGVEGASVSRTANKPNYSLEEVTQDMWRTFVCPSFKIGRNTMKYWHNKPILIDGDTPSRGIYTCIEKSEKSEKSAIRKMLQIWRDMHNPNRNLCNDLPEFVRDLGELDLNERGEAFYAMIDGFPDINLLKLKHWVPYPRDCRASFLKQLKDFRYEAIVQHCRRGLTETVSKQWAVPLSNHPSGVFTYCVDSEVQIPPSYTTLDKAQVEQLQCRRYDKTPWTYDDVPPSLLMNHATVKYIKDEGALVFDFKLQKWMTPCPKSLPPLKAVPVVSKISQKTTQSDNGLGYILGPRLPGSAAGEQRTINIDGVLYGLYKKTRSGREPILNKSFNSTAPILPPKLNPPKLPPTLNPTLPPTLKSTPKLSPIKSPKPPTTQPSTLDFSSPTFSPLVMSDSTAVSLLPVQESMMNQSLWIAIPCIGSAAAAAAVALCVYQHCNRSHTPTHTLIQQYIDEGEIGSYASASYPLSGRPVYQSTIYPLTDMRIHHPTPSSDETLFIPDTMSLPRSTEHIYEEPQSPEASLSTDTMSLPRSTEHIYEEPQSPEEMGSFGSDPTSSLRLPWHEHSYETPRSLEGMTPFAVSATGLPKRFKRSYEGSSSLDDITPFPTNADSTLKLPRRVKRIYEHIHSPEEMAPLAPAVTSSLRLPRRVERTGKPVRRLAQTTPRTKKAKFLSKMSRRVKR
eukprot:Blabericola_migrator_1__1812@NODE_1491_length_4430_cov_14_110016_g978_i0_p1_GENE_NODE_1491_length_4430_cov_14_110016_g978_i0NODE_1491_length_4430_cov_14_110016_g978_i0_p1_ORF_typecomplete_len1125_score173_42IZUMO/PF15005_6/1IZUMO/PF15005_6/1_3e03_NODE_1491_length_4430_cov_14_110016_g978_i06113985